MDRYGLTKNDLQILEDVFFKFPAISDVKIFGSRAKGNFKANSDIDLALYGAALTPTIISLVKFYLEESDLPYSVDVQAYPLIKHRPLAEHIDRLGKIIYQNATVKKH